MVVRLKPAKSERNNMMRDFSWTYFALTGDVDAFMLYREWDQRMQLSGVEMDAIPGDDETEECYTEWKES